jgi:hypothetical protein
VIVAVMGVWDPSFAVAAVYASGDLAVPAELAR